MNDLQTFVKIAVYFFAAMFFLIFVLTAHDVRDIKEALREIQLEQNK